MSAVYSLDASALIYGWSEHYPIDVFPVIWRHLEEIARQDRLLIIDEVLAEARRKDDGLADWIEALPAGVIALDEPIQVDVRAILASHARLLDTRKNKSGADPFVIALARVRAATVITAELATNSLARPKIPDVCRAIGLECKTLVDLFRLEGIVVGGPS